MNKPISFIVQALKLKSEGLGFNATNQNLEGMVNRGTFRKDLYYRITAFPIRLPPLRERTEDIPLLAKSLLKRVAGKRKLSLSLEALTKLTQHTFPGNIRELHNLLERARILASGDTLLEEHFPVFDSGQNVETRLRLTTTSNVPEKGGRMCQVEEGLSLHGVESRYIQHMMENFLGSRTELAHVLGISLRTLVRKIKQTRETPE